MTLESNTGLNVKNNYGPRETGRGTGVVKTEGVKNQLSIELTGLQVSDGVFVEDFIIPKFSIITAVFFEVTEVFELTGNADNSIEIGTDGSEATNGFSITLAQAEALGAYSLTGALSGTWDAEAALAAATTLGVTVAGTTPAIADTGKGRIVIEYVESF